MPINTNLLIMAPVLQDFLIDDQTGLPLANGIITLYRDNSRTTFKNWYYQSGSPGAYTYITLPNPLRLSAAGTIVDNNGNDTIPFYYPYDEVTGAFEPYYITVQDQFGAQKFVRQNFPFITQENTPGSQDVTFQNYVTNSEFWRNIGSLDATNLTSSFVLTTTAGTSTIYYATIAPSNHDGFSMPDIIFAKNANGAVDTLTFQKFTLGSEALAGTNGGVTPEYYFNMNSTGIGTETTKYIQFPIQLHIQNLTNVAAGFSFWAMDANNAQSPITVQLLQYNGTGVVSPVLDPLQTITLTSNWQQYMVNFDFPDVTNAVIASLSNGPSDDAWYIKINYPTGSTANINIALPSFYLGNIFPSNDFQSYDQIDAIINSPRTGDVRTSINSFQPFGWVPANDGVIANTNPSTLTNYARANPDTFQLYNLLWNIAKPYDAGSGGHSNPICQMYTSAGAATDFGATAVADFDAANAIALTRAFGRVMIGTAPISTLLTPQSTTFAASNGAPNLIITTGNTVNFFNGMPIVFTNSGGALPGNIFANAVYYVSNFNGTNAFFVATSFSNAITSTSLIAYSSAGTGTNTVTSAVVGSSEGEYAHTQLLNEIVQHTHDSNNQFIENTNGSSLYTGGGLGKQFPTTLGVTGYISQAAMNVTQPGTFYNIFFKL